MRSVRTYIIIFTFNILGFSIGAVLFAQKPSTQPVVVKENETEDKNSVLCLHLDEEEGNEAHDASSLAVVGKIVNPQRVAGRYGKALRFGKDKSVLTLRKRGEYNLDKGAFTISCWVFPEKLNHRGSNEILNFGSDRGPGWRLTINWRSVAFISGNGKKAESVRSDPTRTEIPLGNWTHLAITRDKEGVFRIYVNGLEVAQKKRIKKNISITKATTPRLTVGSYKKGYAYHFEGLIDEIKILSRDQSASEIYREAKQTY